jgi:hypothetical protein
MSWLNKAVDAEYVLRLQKKKGSSSPSITITRLGKSEASFAVTAITDSSGDTETVVFCEGSLTI